MTRLSEIYGASSVIKSVQRGTVNDNGVTTVNISPVDANKAVESVFGRTTDGSAGNNQSGLAIKLNAAGNQLTIQSGGTSVSYQAEWKVVEWE